MNPFLVVVDLGGAPLGLDALTPGLPALSQSDGRVEVLWNGPWAGAWVPSRHFARPTFIHQHGILAIGNVRLAGRKNRRDDVDRASDDLAFVVAEYRRLGPLAMRELIGDFAFVLWDSRRSQLLAARDALGVKSLYWQRKGGRLYDDQELQDQFDSSTLYRLLEESVVPLFFTRDAGGLPQGWIERMKECLATVPAAFNTDRMVSDYLEQAYRPLAAANLDLGREAYAKARKLAEDSQRVRKGFEKIRINAVQVSDPAKLAVGGQLDAHLEIDLAGLNPSDVAVELVVGHRKGDVDLQRARALALHAAGAPRGTVFTFEGSHRVDRSGSYAYGLRVRVGELVLWA